MPVYEPANMGRQTRKYNPRVRTKRPIGLYTDDDQSPTKPHPMPEENNGKWFLPNPIGARLYQKSGLGVVVKDGILLEPIEVLFCHWNRHVPLDEMWVSKILAEDKDFIAKSVIFDVSRSGGEIVIPVANLVDEKFSSATFALKWARNESHFKGKPISHIRWFWASEIVDWQNLQNWVDEVIEFNCTPEVFVIDDEMDITMYRLGYEDLVGNQGNWSDLSDADISVLSKLIDNRIETESGCFIDNADAWPLPGIGVEHLSGINLRFEEIEWLLGKLNSHPEPTSLFSHLVDAGCVLRPGFKYGCKWRVYDDEVAKSHAPWLLQPLGEAPQSWENMCLSVRLAEGVHKRWICGINDNNDWRFLNVKRWLPGRI